MSLKAENNPIFFDIDQLSGGIYFITAQSESSKVFTTKIIVLK